MDIFDWSLLKRSVGIMNGEVVKRTVRILGAAALVWALAATPAWAKSHGHGHGHAKGKGGMKMGSCARMVKVTAKAEKQLGGAHYKGAMPKKSGMKGMKMGNDKGQAMKMSAGMKGMKGMKGAHEDHDAKSGGVLFMAPNELHHLEGAYGPKCGFQVYLYNAFTKPIGVGRFRAFIKVSGEVNDEDVEAVRFLSPNKDNSILHAQMPHGLKAPFEVELHVKFPEGEDVEIFNFAVDEHGKIS